MVRFGFCVVGGPVVRNIVKTDLVKEMVVSTEKNTKTALFRPKKIKKWRISAGLTVFLAQKYVVLPYF